MTKIRFSFWWPVVFHIGLAAALIWNLWHLIDIRQRILAALALPITANDPEALKAQLLDSLPPIWVWGLTIASIIITLAFVGLGFFPKLSPVRWWKAAGLVWILLWVGYLIVTVILANLALNRLFA